MMTHTWLLKSAIAMAAIGLCGTAIAQSYPARTIRFVITYPPGAPGFDIVQWFAIWLPAKTPKDIAGKLHGEVVHIVQSPDYKQRQFEVAADVVGSSSEALANLQKTEIDKYRKIAASAGITPE